MKRIEFGFHHFLHLRLGLSESLLPVHRFPPGPVHKRHGQKAAVCVPSRCREVKARTGHVCALPALNQVWVEENLGRRDKGRKAKPGDRACLGILTVVGLLRQHKETK